MQDRKLQKEYKDQLAKGYTVEPFYAETAVADIDGGVARWGDFIIMPPFLKKPRICTITTIKQCEMERAWSLQYNEQNKGKKNKEVYSRGDWLIENILKDLDPDALWEPMELETIPLTGIDATDKDIQFCIMAERLTLEVLKQIADWAEQYKHIIIENKKITIDQGYIPPTDEELIKMEVKESGSVVCLI